MKDLVDTIAKTPLEWEKEIKKLTEEIAAARRNHQRLECIDNNSAERESLRKSISKLINK